MLSMKHNKIISDFDKILMSDYDVFVEDDTSLNCSVVTMKSKLKANDEIDNFQVVCAINPSLRKMCSLYSFRSWRTNASFFSGLYLFPSNAKPTLKYNRVMIGLLPMFQRITTNALFDSRVDLARKFDCSYRFKKDVYSYFPTASKDI